MSPLRRQRRLAGLGLSEAARLAGISTSHLAALERSGGANLSFGRAQLLAAVYGCQILDLVTEGVRNDLNDTRAARR